MRLETPPPALQDLIDQARAMPLGREERDVVRQALTMAEELHLDGWAYLLRLWFNRSCFMVGDTDALLTSFTRSLAIHDSNPERFPLSVDEDTHLLFQYKWVADLLNDSPAYSLTQITQIYNDMERRYQQAGVSPSGYLQTRFGGACDRGEWDDAEHYFAQLQAAPRDDLSHCDACSRSTAALYYRDKGDTQRARELLQEIFDGNFMCGDEPEYSETQAMFLALRDNDLESARFLHHKSLTAIRAKEEPGSMLLAHVDFCVLTGNTPRAVALVEQFPRVFDASPLNVARQFHCLTTLAVLADAMIADGHGDLPIRGTSAPHFARLLGLPHHDGTPTRDLTPHDISAPAWQQARTHADAFNARNNTSHYDTLYANARARREERWDLPLGIDEYHTPVSTPVAPTPVSVLDHVAAIYNTITTQPDQALTHYQASRDLPTTDDSPELTLALFSAPVGALPDNAPAYNDLLDDLATAGRPELAATMHAVGPRYLTDLTTTDIDVLLTTADALRTTHPGDAAYLLLDAADILTATDPARAHSLATDAHTLMTGQAGRYKTALMAAGTALNNGDADTASTLLAQAEPLAYGNHRLDTHATFLRATLAIHRNDWATALSCFDQAATTALSHNNVTAAWQLLARKATIHTTINQPTDAARTLRQALRHADTAQVDQPTRISLTGDLGRALLAAGHPHDAIGHLSEALDWHITNDSAPDVVLELLHTLGEAGYASGHAQQAFSAWMYALNYAEEHNQPTIQYTTAIRLADFLTEVEHEDAPTYAAQAMALATEHGEPLAVVQAAKRVATTNVAITRSADLSALDHAEQALDAATVSEADQMMARIELGMHRAQLLWRMDHNADAIAAAHLVADLARSASVTPAVVDALTIMGLAHRDAGEPHDARARLSEARDLITADSTKDGHTAEDAHAHSEQITFLTAQIEALNDTAQS